jgi:hypothetical protein
MSAELVPATAATTVSATPAAAVSATTPTAVSAATTATATPTTTAATPLGAGLGFVDGQGPAAQVGAVEGVDGGIAPVRHFDETEAAGAAGLTVHDDLRRGHGAVRLERRAERVRSRVEREIADVQILTHGHPSSLVAPFKKSLSRLLAATPGDSQEDEKRLSPSMVQHFTGARDPLALAVRLARTVPIANA